MPKIQKPQTGNQGYRTTNFEFRAITENTNQLEISFSSEFPVSRWFGNEVLLHDDGAVELERLATAGTVLFTHGRDVKFGKMPVARIDKAWLDTDQKKCKALITFDEDEDSQRIKSKIESGSIRGISFGYSVSSWEEVLAGKMSANGRFIGPAWLGLKWEPYEISIEPVPADPSVGVGREFEEVEPPKGRSNIITENEEDEEMPKALRNRPTYAPETGAAGGAATPPVANDNAAREAAVIAERQRTSEITSLCREFGIDPTEHINNGISVDGVRTQILNKLMEERKAPNAGTPNVQVTNAEEDKIRDAASDGILMRAGRTVQKPAEGSRDFRGMTLRDLAIECVSKSGVVNAQRMDNDELFRAAITSDSQFAAILSTTVNKSMATAYTAAGTTFEAWTGRGSNPDFKGATVYQISEAGELVKMTQSGEFKSDEMTDSGVSKSIATFGRKFGITRQALINDDLGVITKVPEAYVRAAKRGINALVYKTLGSNPTIYDGTPLFHANHGNLGTAGLIGTDTLGKMREQMRKQKNLRGKETLNIAPAYLITPASLETQAQKMLVSLSDPNSANAGVANIFKNAFTLVVDAELDNYSTTSYYSAANPADVDTIEVTYLNGDSMPKLESRVGFDFLGMEWRIYIDYGVTVLDYRGLNKNPGQ